jgi:hypothetical protein
MAAMGFTTEHVRTVCKEDGLEQCAYLGSKMDGTRSVPVCMRGVAEVEHLIGGINKFHADKGGAQINCTGAPDYSPITK